MVNMARLSVALLDWTPAWPALSPLPSQVPGEVHRMGWGPAEATEAPVAMPWPVVSQY